VEYPARLSTVDWRIGCRIHPAPKGTGILLALYNTRTMKTIIESDVLTMEIFHMGDCPRCSNSDIEIRSAVITGNVTGTVFVCDSCITTWPCDKETTEYYDIGTEGYIETDLL
jgi:hypothetical protein